MKAAAAVLVLLGFGATGADAVPKTTTTRLSCAAFMEAYARAAGNHKASFERPLNITRGFFGDEAGLDVRVLSTGDEDVEGTLKCKDDAFRRFEVRIALPAQDPVIAAFRDYEEAALTAAFGWDHAKVQTVVAALSSDAADYLHASIQRGDTYISGKVEYHQGDTLDLGVIWTEQDRMLVVTTQDAE